MYKKIPLYMYTALCTWLYPLKAKDQLHAFAFRTKGNLCTNNRGEE